jgi:hypothetical protein
MKMRHSPRRSMRLRTLVAAIVLTLEVPGMCEAGEPTRRLFLDDYHIQSMTGLSRVYHQPVKHPVPVIVPDKPWETTGFIRPVGWYPYGSHTQVWSPPVWNPELSKWQLWYQGGKEGLPLYAESTDGVNWVKPNLGLYEWGGNKNNNITLLPTAPYSQSGNSPTYRIVVVRDTFETNPNRRYKGLVMGSSGLDISGGLIRLISPDGKTWTREGTDVIPAGDEYRLGQDPVTGQFWAIIKLGTWQVPDYKYPADFHPPAYRVAWLRTSSDFVNWTPPQLVGYGTTSDQTQAAAQIAAYKANPAIRKLLYDQPTTLLVNRPAGQSGAYTADVYNMPVFRYQDMFLGLPTRQLQTGWFWPVDKPAPANNDGWAFPYLVSSRNLTAWNKHTGNPFCDVSPLSDTQKTDHGMIHMQPPITLGDQLVFYYTGFRFTHHLWWKMDPTWDKDGIPGLDYNYTAAGLTPAECAKEPSVAIHLARLRLDGFASLHAGNTAGEVVTKSLPVNGKSLFVNAAAQAGTLKAELLDATTGEVIPGYTLANSVAIKTDAVRARLQWQGVTDLSALAGRSVRIRFSVQNADLYSFWIEQ